MPPKNLSKFSLKATTEAQEAAYDVIAARKVQYPSGFISTTANLVKGALGSGILNTHVAFKTGGATMALISTIFLGLYIGFCYWMLAMSARKLYRRTRVPRMTYSEVGEAAFACSLSPTINKLAKPFRYSIDILIIFELFGSCCCYQLIIAKTIKQIVEDAPVANVEPIRAESILIKTWVGELMQVVSIHLGLPSLRVYVVVLMLPFIAVCLIRHLEWLAPLSIAGNCFIVLCIGVTVNYAMTINPKFENMVHQRGVMDFFNYVGMIMFSMSCIGVILPAECNMMKPQLYTPALMTAMTFIICAVATSGFFGYTAFLDKCTAPITMNFDNSPFLTILKGLMAFMVYVTHALNFWVPFELIFKYIECRVKDKRKVIYYDFFYRAFFCFCVSVVSIIFPNVSAIMGFLGCFCLSNLIFIFPNLIYLMTVWDRPGLGACKWRMIMFIMITVMGLALFGIGSYVNGISLIKSIMQQ